jgi:uncharacterized protein (TIGR02996 family)
MAERAAIPADQEALLRAIGASQDDDTPRLVYADWLDEHGDPEQAAFIRESIAHAREDGKEKGKHAPHPTGERAREWRKRLGLEHADEHGFHRGFPRMIVYYSAEDFLIEVASLFELLPIHDLAIFWQYGQSLDEEALTAIAARPEIARLHTLRLANYNDEIPLAGWKVLLHSPFLRGLRMLSAGGCGLTDDHARALAECGNLAGLTAIDLSDNAITAAGAMAVLQSPYLQNISKLSLVSNKVDEGSDLYREIVDAVTERFGSDRPLRYLFEEVGV